MDPPFFDKDLTTGNLSDIFLQRPRARNQQEIPPPALADPDHGVVRGNKDEEDEKSSKTATGAQAMGSPEGSGIKVRLLWTEQEEMTILLGFLDFKKQQGKARSSSLHRKDSFYEQIKKQLPRDFTDIQIRMKLHCLKDKYIDISNRSVPASAFGFKNDHDRDCFEISRKIWGAGTKRALEDGDGDPAPAIAVGAGVGPSTERWASGSSGRRPRTAEEEKAPSSISAPGGPEESVDSYLSKIIKELGHLAMSGTMVGGFMPGIDGGKFGMNLNPLQLGTGNSQVNLPVDEKWRNQNILEMEVYLKRIELIRDQVKSALEELKSMAPSSSGT